MDACTAKPAAAQSPTATTFAAACARHLKAKQRKKIKESSFARLVTTMEVHLLPTIGPDRLVNDIDPDVVSGYVDVVDAQNERIREAADSGKPLRRPMTKRELQRSGGKQRMTQKLVAISDGQLNKHLEVLQEILEPFVGTQLDENPVGVCNHRRVYEAKGNWKIQSDEVVSLLAASERLDRPIDRPKSRRLKGACAHLRRDGLTYKQIASKLGISQGTVGHHLRRHAEPVAPIIPMYRALIFLLIIAGLRISEALALRCEDIDLFHDNIDIRESKTGAGRRLVHIHDPFRTVLAAYVHARGASWETGAYVFRSRNGTALSRHNIARRTMPRLIAEANYLRDRQGHPPIRAHVTAHAMRHAYVALLAHGQAPRIYTQTQAGHARPTTADWAYNYVFENEAREQVGTGILGVLERAQGELDGSRRRSYVATLATHAPQRVAESRQLVLW